MRDSLHTIPDADRRRRASGLLLKSWLVYGAWCSCLGWILSAVHQLNATAYAVAALVSLVIGAGLIWMSRPRIMLPRFRRFRRPLPAIYLLLLLGSFVGGAIHPPNNYDMLTYRVPRLLNWLADGRWHWITGYIDRMNYSGTGFEWSALPLLLLARGTSLFFLINIVSYLFLPGLFFGFLRSFGVGRRTAWNWMWLFPAGLNFVMQAGSGGNDTVAVVYFLAAIVFAFRARTTGRAGDVFWSILAAALMTATKSSNLFLALPCLVALIPSLPLLKRHVLATAAVLPVAILSSLLPTLALNFKFTHDWTGSPGDPGHLRVHNPVAGLIGNGLQMAVINFAPPVMPVAGKWNAIAPRLLPGAVDRLLKRDFPRFSLHMGELPQEESAGLGFGLTAMAIISLAATVIALLKRRDLTTKAHEDTRMADGGSASSLISVSSCAFVVNPAAVILSGLAALLLFMALLGSESTARLASPYYPILIAPLLVHPVNGRMVRRGWWKFCAILAALMVVPGLILSPARPLFPAVRWTAALAARHPNNVAAGRAAVVYQVYADRADNLAPLRNYIPADARVVGIVGTLDTSETSLWMPIGSRRVVELVPGDSRATAAAAGIRFVVLEAAGLEEQHSSIERFLAIFGGRIVGREKITLRAAERPGDWFVVDLKG
jgi:hypothetical protein